MLLPPVLPVEDLGEMRCLPENLKTMSRVHSKTMHRESLSSLVSSSGREPPSKVKKTNAVLKRVMTTRHGGWRKKRLGNYVKISVACVTSGRQCTKFPGPMEEFH